MYRYTYTYACTLRNVIGKVLWHTCCLTFKMAWHTASLFCLPGPIIHYILFRDGRERFQGTALSFTDTQGIQPLQEYSYQLKACTAAGCAVSCKVRRAHLTMGRRVQGQGCVNEHLGYELSKARKQARCWSCWGCILEMLILLGIILETKARLPYCWGGVGGNLETNVRCQPVSLT